MDDLYRPLSPDDPVSLLPDSNIEGCIIAKVTDDAFGAVLRTIDTPDNPLRACFPLGAVWSSPVSIDGVACNPIDLLLFRPAALVALRPYMATSADYSEALIKLVNQGTNAESKSALIEKARMAAPLQQIFDE